MKSSRGLALVEIGIEYIDENGKDGHSYTLCLLTDREWTTCDGVALVPRTKENWKFSIKSHSTILPSVLIDTIDRKVTWL
jgi:hypothetical protein